MKFYNAMPSRFFYMDNHIYMVGTAEFLKDATVRPHGHAKFFRDRARFGFLNSKMHNLPLFYLFSVIFQTNC